MGHSESLHAITLLVAAAIIGNRFVKPGAAAVAVQADSLGENTLGVASRTITAQNVTDGDVSLAVVMSGVMQIEAGAAVDVSAGAVPVMTDASGRAIAATATNLVLGWAIESAAAAGEQISVILDKGAGVL